MCPKCYCARLPFAEHFRRRLAGAVVDVLSSKHGFDASFFFTKISLHVFEANAQP